MEAAGQHERGESGNYILPLELISVTRLIMKCPQLIVSLAARRASFSSRLLQCGGADAWEAGEGRHPTSALKKITSGGGGATRQRHIYLHPHWSAESTAEVVSFCSSTSYHGR
ncbi:hypothetical protein PBY51_021017 [Eleginops maclovinus]|uniref:Uncharacterized protein n=1 Tax=Eleginops maclovinus TaxID=56733 RepID=A0AAN7XEM7_ELEMC|nr:hypothetical protein PBY51_021017 [Eleginops maclovinus]